MQIRPLAAALEQRFRPDDTFPLASCDFTLDDAPIERVHRHDVLEFGLCRHGAGTYLVEGKSFRFAAGDAVVIGPREAHYSRSDDATTSRWTYLHGDPLRLLAGLEDPDGALAVPQLAGPEFCNLLAAKTHRHEIGLLHHLARVVAERPPLWRSEARGLLLALLAALQRLPGRTRPEAGVGESARLLPAIQLMSGHFRAALGIPALARACNMGETTFRRHFASVFGHGPKEHLVRLRLAHAAGGLRRGEDVTAAALAAGFPTLSVFHRLFRARYGCAPRAWLSSSH